MRNAELVEYKGEGDRSGFLDSSGHMAWFQRRVRPRESVETSHEGPTFHECPGSVSEFYMSRFEETGKAEKSESMERETEGNSSCVDCELCFRTDHCGPGVEDSAVHSRRETFRPRSRSGSGGGALCKDSQTPRTEGKFNGANCKNIPCLFPCWKLMRLRVVFIIFYLQRTDGGAEHLSRGVLAFNFGCHFVWTLVTHYCDGVRNIFNRDPCVRTGRRMPASPWRWTKSKPADPCLLKCWMPQQMPFTRP
jgi:hypothetical protein